MPGNTLVITGRTALVDEEPATAACADAQALRRCFVDAVRSGALRASPADIDRRVQKVVALREVQLNLADFTNRGARVEYHAIDATDDAAMGRLIAGVQERLGSIGGVVHGAGVIEDRLLVDKTADSWSRVVETKVLGLLALLRHLRPDALRFLTVFSSVAGRYGNRGQTDYATANELMNRLCCQLRDQWGDRVGVSALCWGPWGATTFGAGMVTAETEAKFAAKGVALVDAAQGRRLFADAVRAAPGGPVEIVCGQGAWEAHEAAAPAPAASDAVAPVAAEAALLGPLLGRASSMPLPLGEQRITVALDAAHAYLAQHRIDGVAVLPAAAALELMAEAARALWPGWQVVEARDLRLIKGIEVKETGRSRCTSSSPRLLTAAARASTSAWRSAPTPVPGDPSSTIAAACGSSSNCRREFTLDVPRHDQLQLAVGTAYDEMLFHGPCFQVIEAIDGLSDRGAGARVRSTRPKRLAGWPGCRLTPSGSSTRPWSTPPRRWRSCGRARSTATRACRRASAGSRACATPAATAAHGIRARAERRTRTWSARTSTSSTTPAAWCCSIEGMECVGSAALNRLGGTAARPAPSAVSA